MIFGKKGSLKMSKAHRHEELTKDIYAPAKMLLEAKDSPFDVVPPQTNIMYPAGLLDKIGVKSSKTPL